MSIRLVLADDHRMFRDGLRLVLERAGFIIAGEADHGMEAVELARRLRPDIVILDLSMPVMNGIEAAEEIGQEPDIRTLLLTMRTEEHYILRAFASGVSGYVLKSRAATDLIRAIHEVNGGNLYVSPAVSNTIVRGMLTKDPPSEEHLSLRERQVLQLIAEGKSTKEIAGVIGVSVRTAETHRARIMEKLDLHETASLVRYAIRHGFAEA